MSADISMQSAKRIEILVQTLGRRNSLAAWVVDRLVLARTPEYKAAILTETRQEVAELAACFREGSVPGPASTPRAAGPKETKGENTDGN